jgi:hypothetical protein
MEMVEVVLGWCFTRHIGGQRAIGQQRAVGWVTEIESIPCGLVDEDVSAAKCREEIGKGTVSLWRPPLSSRIVNTWLTTSTTTPTLPKSTTTARKRPVGEACSRLR